MISSSAIEFDSAIMARYAQTGPRYTSYPTTPQFRQQIAAEEYVRAAKLSEDALLCKPVSLYVHIPFCYSPCLYCGCNKVITRDLTRVDRYCRYLSQEIAWRGTYFDSNRVVEQLHFGGGTPTFLTTNTLVHLMRHLGRHFHLTESAERDYSTEIDPRSVSQSTLALLNELGFNRLSLGVQDFDPHVQYAINRVQPVEMVQAVYKAARGLGFRSINFDLIYGLPQQTLETFGQTLDRVIAMRPDRVAVYGYAHMPQLFKAQRRIRTEELPDASTRMALMQLAIERLSEAGYLYIGLDHFALPGDSLAQAKRHHTLHRSFQGYTTHATLDLVSFGVSAIGRVGNLFVQNYKVLADYEAAVERGLLPTERGIYVAQDDRIRAEVIQQIMCHGRVDIHAVQARHGIDFGTYFSPELKRLEPLREDGLVEVADSHITLSPSGQLLMRTVAMAFDAYLNGSPEPLAMSRVV